MIYDKKQWKKSDFSINSAESFGFYKEKKVKFDPCITPHKQKSNPGIKSKIVRIFLKEIWRLSCTSQRASKKN